VPSTSGFTLCQGSSDAERPNHDAALPSFATGTPSASAVSRCERLAAVRAGPAFEADGAAVAHVCEDLGDGREVDLSGAGFAASGDVGDLDLADDVESVADELDQVPSPIWAW
jgi:hypothetical protein